MNFQSMFIGIGLGFSVALGWITIWNWAFRFGWIVGGISIILFLLWCWLIKWNIFTIKD